MQAIWGGYNRWKAEITFSWLHFTATRAEIQCFLRQTWLSLQQKTVQSASPASQQCHIFIRINSERNRISGLQSGDTCLQDRGVKSSVQPRMVGLFPRARLWSCASAMSCPSACQSRELGAWQQIKTPCCRSITARGHWSRLTVPVHRGRPKYTVATIDSLRQDPQQVNSQWNEVFVVGARPRHFNERFKK